MQRRTQRSEAGYKTTTERGYGWRWQQARLKFLDKNPLCRPCKEKGRVAKAVEVDHIIPHQGDERLMWDENNWQPICKDCHQLKSLTEDAHFKGANTHPAWLPKPQCKVVLVTGPAGGGKSTYCRNHAHEGDVVIDLDDCFTEVCGVHGHTANRKYLAAALRLRNNHLAGLSRRTTGTAYVIVTSPSQKETDWWVDRLNAKHVLIDPGFQVCATRVSGKRRNWAYEWYIKRQANNWQHPTARPQIGSDGWPVEAGDTGSGGTVQPPKSMFS